MDAHHSHEEWVELAKDRDAALRALADELGHLLYVMNIVSGGPAEDLRQVAHSGEARPFWHVEQAHILLLTQLTGDPADGQRLHDLWSGTLEDTAWNQRILADQKRARRVLVTVAADGDTATIDLPDGPRCHAGRVADSGLFWVADTLGTVIGHSSAWPGLGRVAANAYAVPHDIAVVVEYTQHTTDQP